jgi:hypothetical protein
MSISKRQFRIWMFIQLVAALVGCGLWFYFTARSQDDSSDSPQLAAAGDEVMLYFLVLRLIPAGFVLVAWFWIEWLLFRLFFSDKGLDDK